MVKIEIIPHEFNFRIPATTSRNTLKTHRSHLIKVCDEKVPNVCGWGEAAPLPLLSIDHLPDFEEIIRNRAEQLMSGVALDDLDLVGLPSLRFAFETAFNDLKNGGVHKIFDTDFYTGESIKINGLVWMGDLRTMLDEALIKARAFDTIKFKVGALDFDEECIMIESFRKQFSSSTHVLRLDANGAFALDDALKKLNELKRFDIHSIEQPIHQGQWDAMEEICAKSPIDIALDEELIGVDPHTKGQALIQKIKPQFLILKPTLLGGFSIADQWIKLAEKNNAKWWATSALEGNVGLNAIAQWVSQYKNPLPQGLGTGQLYTNNFVSPLEVKGGELRYRQGVHWQLV